MAQTKRKNRRKKKPVKGESDLQKLLSFFSLLKIRNGMRRVPASSETKEFRALESFISQFNANEIVKYFEKASKHWLFKRSTNPSLKEPSSFYDARFGLIPIEKSLTWCALVLRKNSEKINSAIEYENRITELILSGESASILEGITSEIPDKSFSLWEYKLLSGISTLNLCEGYCFDRSAATELTKGNSLITYFIEIGCGYYQDEDVFAALVKMESGLFERNKPHILDESLRYHTLPLKNIGDTNFETLFSVELDSPLYDLYKLFKYYLMSMCACDKSQSLINGNTNFLPLVSECFSSSPITVPCIQAGSLRFEDMHYNDLFVLLEDLYNLEKYEELIDLANEYCIEKLPFSIFELVVRADIRSKTLNASGFVSRISREMKNVMLRNEYYSTSYNYLSFVSFNLRSLEWFDYLRVFLIKEGKYATNTEIENAEKYLTLSQAGHSTKYSRLLGREYIEYLWSIYPDNSTVELAFNSIENKANKKYSLNLSPQSQMIHKIKSKISSGEYRAVVENLHMLISSTKDELVLIEAKKLLMSCYINLKQTDKSAKAFVDDVIDHSGASSIYDIEEIITSILPTLSASDSIDIPITLSAYSNEKGNKYDSELKFSFDVFLSKNRLSLPQELFGKEDRFGNEKLHYFLRNVCTQKNMALYLGFESSDDVEQCRVDICNYLIRQNGDTDSIANELKAINKSRARRVAAKRVDENKIFVDETVFTGAGSSNYRIMFEKYNELSSQKLVEDEGMDQVKPLIDNIEQNRRENGELSKYNIYTILSTMQILTGVKIGKKNGLFLSLAKLFRDEFTFGERGLNGHLSTRIRHGYLPDTIRKAFNAEGLYLKKNELTKKRATDWKIGHATSLLLTENELLAGELIKFTGKVEKYIEEIRDSWVQIETIDSRMSKVKNIDHKDGAVFNFSISPFETYYLESKLPISPSYDDLVQVMVEWLWTRTDHNLVAMKEKLTNEAEPYLASCLEGLKQGVLALDLASTLENEVCNTIDRSKTKLTKQLDLVRSWFTRGDVIDPDELHELSTIVDIAATALSIDVEFFGYSGCKVSGYALSNMVNLFHILFENALSKSNLERENVEIHVECTKNSDGTLALFIRNRVNKNIDEIRRTIDFYLEVYGDEELIRDSIQKEGGTGFFKIWKILEKDLRIQHNINIKCSDSGIFSVEFTITPDQISLLL